MVYSGHPETGLIRPPHQVGFQRLVNLRGRGRTSGHCTVVVQPPVHFHVQKRIFRVPVPAQAKIFINGGGPLPYLACRGDFGRGTPGQSSGASGPAPASSKKRAQLGSSPSIRSQHFAAHRFSDCVYLHAPAQKAAMAKTRLPYCGQSLNASAPGMSKFLRQSR